MRTEPQPSSYCVQCRNDPSTGIKRSFGLTSAGCDTLLPMRIVYTAAFVLAPIFALAGCGDAPIEDTHGFAKIQFARSVSEADSPYGGTREVVIQMAYEDCYQQFYAANPNWGLDSEDGALVFGSLEDGGEGWMDRLCEEDVGGRADCEVTDFQQLLDDSGLLTVTYNITGPLEDRVLLFGPLPNAELAQCNGGSAPSVRLSAGSTRGRDANGDTVWTVSTSNPAKAGPGDGGAVLIEAAR